MSDKSIIESVVEAIQTYPHDFITIEKFCKYLPELSAKQIRSCFAKELKMYGYIVSLKKRSAGVRSIEYEIISRKDLSSVKLQRAISRREEIGGVVKKLVPPTEATIESSKVGEAIYDFITRLKEEISKLSYYLENERTIKRGAASSYERIILELKNEIKIMKEALIVKTEDKSRTFKLSEVMTIKGGK